MDDATDETCIGLLWESHSGERIDEPLRRARYTHLCYLLSLLL